MAGTLNTDRKSPIGLERLVIWPMTKDDSEGITHGTASEISKILMTASDTPTIIQAYQSADNQIVDSVCAKNGGALDLSVTNLSAADRVVFYGETEDNETNITNKDDIVPYVAVAYMTKRTDGKVNLYKYPKVKFTEQQESFETINNNGVNFATTSLKGNYEPTLANGDARYVRRGVDPKTDSELITTWFTTAETYKPTV